MRGIAQFKASFFTVLSNPCMDRFYVVAFVYNRNSHEFLSSHEKGGYAKFDLAVKAIEAYQKIRPWAYCPPDAPYERHTQ